MKYRGTIEYLPKVCLDCLAPRRTALLLGDDEDRELEAILPCANPGCSGSIAGEGLNILFEAPDGVRMAISFERATTADGYAWRRSTCARAVPCP